MTKKMYALLSGILGGVAAIAEAIVGYVAPENMLAILAAIPIVVTAANEVMMLFVTDGAKK